MISESIKIRKGEQEGAKKRRRARSRLAMRKPFEAMGLGEQRQRQGQRPRNSSQLRRAFNYQ